MEQLKKFLMKLADLSNDNARDIEDLKKQLAEAQRDIQTLKEENQALRQSGFSSHDKQAIASSDAPQYVMSKPKGNAPSILPANEFTNEHVLRKPDFSRPSDVARKPLATNPNASSSFSSEASARMEDCRKAYQALNAISGLTFRTQSNDFLQTYHIVPLTCADSVRRIEGSAQSATFRQAESPFRADCWAAPLGGGHYAVFPRSHATYDGTLHTAGGLGEAFDSNYTPGAAYTAIDVTRPAIFESIGETWNVREKGRLVLG